MPRARETWSVRMNGSFMGIKVNVSSKNFERSYKRLASLMSISKQELLRDLMKLFKRRLEKRVPKLIEQLQDGVQGLVGTREFESVGRHSGKFKHRPHQQIPDPLTRIVERGTRYLVTAKRDRLRLDMRVYNTRRTALNFHTDMPKVPRISTVWSRLDATCLPFVKEGHRDAIIERWLFNSGISLQSELMKYVKDRKLALSSGGV